MPDRAAGASGSPGSHSARSSEAAMTHSETLATVVEGTAMPKPTSTTA